MSLRNKLKVSSSVSLEHRVMLFAPPAFDLSPFNFNLGNFAEPISQAEPAQPFQTQDFGSFDLTRFGLGVGGFSDPVSEAEPVPQPPPQDFGSFDLTRFGLGVGSFSDPVSQPEPAPQPQDFGSFDLTRFGLGAGGFSDPVSEPEPAPQPPPQDFGSFDLGQLGFQNSSQARVAPAVEQLDYVSSLRQRFPTVASTPQSISIPQDFDGTLDNLQQQSLSSQRENGGVYAVDSSGIARAFVGPEGELTLYPGENYSIAINNARRAGYEPVGYFHTHFPYNGQPAANPPSGGDLAFLTVANIVAAGNGLVRDTAGNTYYYFATGETVASYDSVLQEWNGYFNSGNRDAYIPTATNNGIAVYFGGPGETILQRLN